MATRREKQDQAVYQVFRALRELRPDVLRELRDGHDPGQWGARHLPSDPIIQYAQRLHAHWAKHPDEGQRLGMIRPMPGAVYREYTQAERKWLAAVMADPEPWFVPMPYFESLTQWLERATELYREREQMIVGPWDQKRIERNDLPKLPEHCRWFVQLHFENGVRPAEIAKTASVTREAVLSGVKTVAALIRIRPTRRRPGRPTMYLSPKK